MGSKSSDRVILITGASRGIGRSLSEHYLEQGDRVIGCSRSSSTLQHNRYRHFEADVTDETAVKSMFREIANSSGHLDVLINSAGIASMNHVLLTPVRAVREIFETNFIGTFLLCREAGKLMKSKGRGRIVNMTSVAAPLKLEGEAVYAASKAAVETFSQIIARELADFGITVNTIGPTPIETGLISGVPKEKIEGILQRQAISRMGEFRDVVNVVDFFIRPESDFLTGQVIYLGGI